MVQFRARSSIPNYQPAATDSTYTPDYTANVGLTYTLPLSDGELSLNANYAYNSGFYGRDNTYGQGLFGGQRSVVGPSSRYRDKILGQESLECAYDVLTLPKQSAASQMNFGASSHGRVAVAFRK